ncbi:MAG: hypothetical protein A2Y64_01565 [Candidatus Coatesbacteria bacterium RBG_13_66_14]|uniref:Uncharacterized protein n=1 Tax=Candidatus Coatesbacteria bacterium RBG_13_66_14 TaxID=1817816 RepID=A0A1F5EX06_9BACT|nr:MAG: hypothetical protein A2Y64_01565 [Candidatus Coatesbacteria bacterium RBG_13_66_14]
MTGGNFTTRALGTAALTAALIGLPAAANYLVPVFFEVYLEPWFWPALAAAVTLIALIRLFTLARRFGEARPFRAALRGMIFLAPKNASARSVLPAVVWPFWAAALVMGFRAVGPLSVWPGAALTLGEEAISRVAQLRFTIPFVLWPSIGLALGVAALATSLRERRPVVLPLVAVALSLLFIAGDFLLRDLGTRINASSEEMLQDEIQRMIEEAKTQ